MKLNIKAAAFCLALLPAGAIAQTQPQTWCGANLATLNAEVASSLEGFWAVANGGGILSIANRTIVLPPGNETSALINRTPDGLTISGEPFGGETFPLNFVTDQPLQLLPSGDLLDPATQTALFGDDHTVTTLGSDEIAILADCPEAAIPQLSASGRIQIPEGPVDFELHLFVIDSSRLYGVIKGTLTTRGGVAKRVTTFSR